MAGRYLLYFVLLCVISSYSECKRYGSSSGRSSGSSWGRSWGSSSASKPSSSSSWSSSGSSKPSSSSSSSSWWSSGSSAPKYPSSSSGLSGYGSSAHTYPSSSSGLSGFGSSAHNYPSSSSGLSGYGSSAPTYPSSSSGLSGFGSSSHNYPSSSSGLSGYGSSAPTYPSSSSGLSGFGSSAPRYPSSSTGLSGWNTDTSWQLPAGVEYMNRMYPSSSGNKYPSSSWSGSGSGSGIQKNNYYASHSSNSGNGQNNYPTHRVYNTPTYYTSPQHVYITEYRNSESRYGDLLSGLALYNLGRSHNYHNHYYYNDDYYRRRPTSGSSSYDPPNHEATCTLRIKENNKIEALKIPCEIVSTFTEGSKKVSADTYAKTVCVTNYTVINDTTASSSVDISITTSSPVNMTILSNVSRVNTETAPKLENNQILVANRSGLDIPNTASPVNNSSELELPAFDKSTMLNTTALTMLLNNLEPVSKVFNTSVAVMNNSDSISYVSTNVKPQNTNSSLNVTVMETTTCTIPTDPLKVKGPPVNATNNMECAVDIVTKDSHVLRTKVDCSTLLSYAKMPEPKKEQSAILPSRNKLKTWLSNPPWWLSLFIAV